MSVFVSPRYRTSPGARPIPAAIASASAGIRLTRQLGDGALDDLEPPARQQSRHAQPRELVRLVGEHGHGDAPSAKFIQQLGNAWIGLRLFRPAASVLAPRQFYASGEERLRQMLLTNCAADQLLEPVTHELLVRLHGVPGQSEFRKRRVRGIGQVVQRIQQGSIEIEQYGAADIHGATIAYSARQRQNGGFCITPRKGSIQAHAARAA